MEDYKDDKASNCLSQDQIARIRTGWEKSKVFSGFAAVVEGPKEGKTPLKFATVGPDLANPIHLIDMGEYCFKTAVEKINSQGAEPKFALDYITCGNFGEDKDRMLEGILNMSELFGIPLVGGEVSIHEGGASYCVVFMVGW